MSLFKQMPLLAFIAMTAFSMKAHTQSGVVYGPQNKPTATSSNSSHQIKSYREWKHELVVDAQSKVTGLKSQIEARKQARSVNIGIDPNLARSKGLEAFATRDASVEKLEKELRTELYDLDVANDLTVTDYFVGYLTKVQNKKAAFKEVAGKLSPEEVAELMTAYANSVFGANAADLPPSAANITKDPVK